MRASRLLGIAFGFTFTLAGCFVPTKKHFVDVFTRDWSPEASLSAQGDVLHIFVPENLRELAVADIRPEVIEGNVYLFTRYMSHVRRNAEFTFDMSGKGFPSDWKERLYWIEYDAIPSPLNPFIKDRVHELHRRKVSIAAEKI